MSKSVESLRNTERDQVFRRGCRLKVTRSMEKATVDRPLIGESRNHIAHSLVAFAPQKTEAVGRRLQLGEADDN